MLVKPPHHSFALLPLLTVVAAPAISAEDVHARVAEAYGKVPLQFEANRGQADEAVRFLARGKGYGLYLAPEAAVLVLAKPSENASDEPRESVALRVSAVGARANPPLSGVDELPGKANYFIGNDPSQWRTNVPTYGKVRYGAVYPGIDLVYYGQQRQLEYDFVVAPGADPGKIVLGFEGADALEIDAQGDLVLHTAAGDVRQHKPVVYQETDGDRREIGGGYARKGATRVGFEVAEYDHSRPLVIDPVLSYSTYLGGSSYDFLQGIAIDADGNAYVTGTTGSSNFPTTPGALPPSGGGVENVFVSKLNSSGSAVVYSAYFGGISIYSGITFPYGIAIDSDRNVYITGGTNSPTFPTTAGALQTSNNGGRDAFVTKLNATGSNLVYSTYLGGSSDEISKAIAVDVDGNAYVTGETFSPDFPTTTGAFQTSFGASTDAFVAKLSRSGTALVYSTFLSGTCLQSSSANGIAVDAAGDAYVVGQTDAADFPTTAGAFQTVRHPYVSEAFVTKLDSTGSALVYSTYLGGGGLLLGLSNDGLAVSVDASGHAYVTGKTNSSEFPVTPGAFQVKYAGIYVRYPWSYDAFVTKIDPSGSTLVYSTYLGGSSDDSGEAIAVDIDGNAFVTGSTYSRDFPRTDSCGGGAQDAFVTMLDPSGSALVYSTNLGGSGADDGTAIVLDTGGNAYVAGATSSNDFPTTPLAFQPQFGGNSGSGGDGFVVKIAEPVLPIPAPASPANTGPPPAIASTVTGQADAGSAQTPPAAAAPSANMNSSQGSGGGGAIDSLTLPALLAAVALARRRRA